MDVTYISTSKPMVPVSGQIRFNSSTNAVETYDGTQWVTLASASKQELFYVIDTVIDKLTPPPPGHHIVDVSRDVMLWVGNEMPVHMWKYDSVPAYSSAMDRLIVSDKLLMLMKLKFSA